MDRLADYLRELQDGGRPPARPPSAEPAVDHGPQAVDRWSVGSRAASHAAPEEGAIRMAIATRQIGAVTIFSDEEKGEGGLERIFDAPRSLVWKVMTDPSHIPNWWGPRKYRTEVVEDDHRVGGKWRYVNIAEDGGRHEFFGEYLEIVPEEKVVSSFYYDVPGLNDRAMYDTLTLEDTRRRQDPDAQPLPVPVPRGRAGGDGHRHGRGRGRDLGAPGRAHRRGARRRLIQRRGRATANIADTRARRPSRTGGRIRVGH